MSVKSYFCLPFTLQNRQAGRGLQRDCRAERPTVGWGDRWRIAQTGAWLVACLVYSVAPIGDPRQHRWRTLTRHVLRSIREASARHPLAQTAAPQVSTRPGRPLPYSPRFAPAGAGPAHSNFLSLELSLCGCALDRLGGGEDALRQTSCAHRCHGRRAALVLRPHRSNHRWPPVAFLLVIVTIIRARVTGAALTGVLAPSRRISPFSRHPLDQIATV